MRKHEGNDSVELARNPTTFSRVIKQRSDDHERNSDLRCNDDHDDRDSNHFGASFERSGWEAP